MSSTEIQELNTKLDRLEKLTLLGAKSVLTLDDAALITGLTKGYIYRLTSTQRIPHYKLNGRNLYFRKDEIEEWLLRNKVCSQAEIGSAATTHTAIHKIPK